MGAACGIVNTSFTPKSSGVHQTGPTPLFEERVVHEPQVAIEDENLHHVELLLHVLEDERSDLASKVREQRLSIDLDEERRLEGVQVHALGLCWDHHLGGL